MGFPLLADDAYQYLSTGKITNVAIGDKDLPLVIKALIQQVVIARVHNKNSKGECLINKFSAKSLCILKDFLLY